MSHHQFQANIEREFGNGNLDIFRMTIWQRLRFETLKKKIGKNLKSMKNYSIISQADK